jgi:hypothetical protein
MLAVPCRRQPSFDFYVAFHWLSLYSRRIHPDLLIISRMPLSVPSKKRFLTTDFVCVQATFLFISWPDRGRYAVALVVSTRCLKGEYTASAIEVIIVVREALNHWTDPRKLSSSTSDN